MGEEISEAITSAPFGNAIDEEELNDELAELEQEQLDDKMLQTGHIPVSDQIHKLPAAGNTESEYSIIVASIIKLISLQSKERRPHVWKRMMRKKSYGSYKPRWQCELTWQHVDCCKRLVTYVFYGAS